MAWCEVTWYLAATESYPIRVEEVLSVDLLRYIGEMLFELFSMLCSVIIIIKILFITHTGTTAATSTPDTEAKSGNSRKRLWSSRR